MEWCQGSAKLGLAAGIRESCHLSPAPRDHRLQADIDGPCGSFSPSQNKLSPFSLFLSFAGSRKGRDWEHLLAEEYLDKLR